MKTRGKKSAETNNNSLIPCFLLVDSVVAIAVILFWYFLYYDEDVFKINNFSIHCSDINYKYPWQLAAVTETTLYVVSFLAPTVLIVLFEIIRAEYNSRIDSLPKEKTVITFNFKIKPTIRRIIRYVGLFIIGAFSTLIFSGIGRLIVGRPAPHFFTICPDLLNECSSVGYVQYSSDVCPDVTVQTRSSFPSYFAALSSYAALFGGIYLSKMMTITAARTLRPVFCIVIMLLSFMVCLDRVSSHQEHWTDVIAGSFIGLFIALYMSLGVLSGFEGSLEIRKVNHELKSNSGDYGGGVVGGGIMQTLTREASRPASRQQSRHASRREKGDDFMSNMYEVKYNTANRSYYGNSMDDRRRQEEFVYNHQPPLPSFSADELNHNDKTALAGLKREAHDTDLGDGNVADDDQPMFQLYHN